MNHKAYMNLVTLMGKVVDLYQIDPSDKRFNYDDRALLEQAVREWNFYRPPATEPAVVQTGEVRKSARKT